MIHIVVACTTWGRRVGAVPHPAACPQCTLRRRENEKKPAAGIDGRDDDDDDDTGSGGDMGNGVRAGNGGRVDVSRHEYERSGLGRWCLAPRNADTDTHPGRVRGGRGGGGGGRITARVRTASDAVEYGGTYVVKVPKDKDNAEGG
ncbi:hypothetical protein C2E23DRAFT_609990 [Lenzites betulinus]|nr:hypothetical protein C2E23DRAFT_609990 [Lenzites betulinus]